MITMEGEERTAFLNQYFARLDKWRQLDMNPASAESETLTDQMETLQIQLADMRDVYAEHLPSLALSRCPLSGEVLFHSIDVGGLDGLWWNYDAPVRGLESLPVTYFALDGAVHLEQPLEYAPFLCKPGPGVPGVLPRLLTIPGIKAVISSVRIGPHQGYPIAYFASGDQTGVERINTWGTKYYTFVDRYNMLRWGESLVSCSDYDFHLEPWIEGGQLLWIAPGDQTLTIQSGTTGCPYLGLDGSRQLQRIERGRAWSGEIY